MRSKRLEYAFWVLAGVLVLAACAPQVTTQTTSGLNEKNPYADYTGPKARVVIAPFLCKDPKCGATANPQAAVVAKLFGVEIPSESASGVGSSLADLLTTALINSNHFTVFDRSVLEQLQKEAALSGQAQVLQGADLFITGSITAFEPDASGTRGGGAGGAGSLLGGILAGLAGGQKKAYIAIDFRVVDVRTGAVVSAFRVEAEASDADFGGLLGALVPGTALVGGLSQYQKTPMGKAMAKIVADATDQLIKRVPKSYFKDN